MDSGGVGSSVQRKKSSPKRSSAFDKIRVGLEDAIAHHRGRLTLAAREVELRQSAEPGAQLRALELAVECCRESRKKHD
jgi:hypothetical protein